MEENLQLLLLYPINYMWRQQYSQYINCDFKSRNQKIWDTPQKLILQRIIEKGNQKAMEGGYGRRCSYVLLLQCKSTREQGQRWQGGHFFFS